MTIAPVMDAPAEVAHPTALYRLYAADGLYLYAGVSLDLATRFRAHKGEKPDWRMVARIDLTWYDDRPAALAAESEAIRTEDPLWNRAGHERGAVVHLATRKRIDGQTRKDRLIASIEGSIRSGEYPVRSKLPSGRELCALHGVSIQTVHSATGHLKAKGWVVGAPGAGVFVADDPPI